MVIDVIVSNSSKAVDKAFSYAVPDEFKSEMEIGRRIVVPFARGNREIEGFCVGIHEDGETNGLKSVRYIADDKPVFGEKLLDVIEYMHERYLCSYCELINTVVPAGTAIKMKEMLSVTESDSELSGVRREIADIIKSAGSMERHELLSHFDHDVSSAVREMLKSNELSRKFVSGREVKEKKIKFVRALYTEDEDAIGARAHTQKKAYEFLCSHDAMPLADMLKESGISRASVNELVKKGLAEVYDYSMERDPFINMNLNKTSAPKPTEEQRTAIEKITNSADNGGGAFLLHGVTGSGKTEVFLQSIDYILKLGKTALVLVPEISLTPQMVSRFVSRFDSRVAVIHSGLSKGERYDQWRRIYSGEADIVIGARSAVFAPLDNIGIIIMDEEHSESYKSDMSPRYHAREVALYRAKQFGAPIVFASATPLVESYYKAQSGEYILIEMKKRFNEAKLPPIAIADMRNELAEGNRSMFSRTLYRQMKINLERKEQTILFLNRRGFSTFVSCRSCGYTVQCPHCNISLTYHKFDNMLRCHYCGYTVHNYNLCPKCGSKYIRFFGGGTQRVEDEVHRIFPEATTIRMDIDTTGKKQSHEKLLEKFDKEKIDILVGTQMVAKGLDFENVTLVGAVSADTMLHINDFRSAERTFSMLEQVTGRAGRGTKPGRAVIQTYNPEAEAVSLVTTHDYYSFYKGEIELRKLMWYPPFSKMIVVLFSGTESSAVERCAAYFRKLMGDMRKLDSRVQVLGPVPASITKINNRYRFRMIIKCADDDVYNADLKKAMESCRKNENYRNVSIIIDKNPTNIN
ncbi:MAG: primosomal protein N' [bacterium]|nr:primosomal protein N' [bacterium]